MIKLPNTAIAIKKMTGAKAYTYFRINPLHKKLIIPRHLVQQFRGLGIDMYISPEECSLYITFVPRERCQFSVSNSNCIVCCGDLFKWLHNCDITVFSDYAYDDYEVDIKNKIIKLNLKTRSK